MRVFWASYAHVVACCLTLAAGCAAAGESDYPSKPIRLIAPIAPGGVIDLLARIMGASLGAALGRQFVVDNRPGANGIIGTDLAAKAAPDGYTLLIVPGGFAINPSLYRKLPYETPRDFAYIAMLGHSPYVLTVSSKLGVNDVAGLVELAKSSPGKISFSSSGVGNVTHLAGELLNMTAGLKLSHVPYKGTGQLLPDLYNGSVPVSVISFSSAQRYVKTGNIKLLGLASPQRNPLMPNLPTLREAGLRGYEVMGWYGLLGPAAVPDAIVDKLNRTARSVLRQPDTMRSVVEQGLDLVDWTPAQFEAHVRADIAKWRGVVERLGLAAQ